MKKLILTILAALTLTSCATTIDPVRVNDGVVLSHEVVCTYGDGEAWYFDTDLSAGTEVIIYFDTMATTDIYDDVVLMVKEK